MGGFVRLCASVPEHVEAVCRECARACSRRATWARVRVLLCVCPVSGAHPDSLDLKYSLDERLTQCNFVVLACAQFLEHILAAGNFLNCGTSMGNAAGFRLEALAQVGGRRQSRAVLTRSSDTTRSTELKVGFRLEALAQVGDLLILSVSEL